MKRSSRASASRRPRRAEEAGRRALSHVGGRVEGLRGPPELRAAIVRACSVDPERGVRDHVHGFHSYPARLHPHTAAHLIRALCPESGRVGDAFCGSGTVVVEARRLGRAAVGVDLNPLAVRLSRLKTEPLPSQRRAALLAAAQAACEHAETRREKSAGPTQTYPPAERALYDVHVLLELDGLADGIRRLAPEPLREPLRLALSSMLSKVARDQRGEAPAKRLPAGFAIRFFEARVGEWCRQQGRYEALLPEPRPRVQCLEGDARELGRLGVSGVDLFVSSPPYPGVLDYAEYHRSRLAWLGLSARRINDAEIGSRRRLSRLSHRAAAQCWEQDFARVLSAMRVALSPAGRVALVVADSLLVDRPYFADAMVARCAEEAGLRVLAAGAQRRPHFHRKSMLAFGRSPRREHVILLGPRAPASSANAR